MHLALYYIVGPLDSCVDGQAIKSWSIQNVLFHASALLLFQLVQRINITKLHIFRRSVRYIIQDRILSGASVAPASQVRVFAMLVLLMVVN